MLVVPSSLSPSQSATMTSDYSSLPSYSGSASEKGRVMDQVRSQIAVASAQELIQVWVN